MFDTIKKIWSTAKEIKRAEKIYNSDDYYSDINEIPLFNWWKCKEGDLSYLWKERNKKIPFFFKRIYGNFTYQLDFLDLSQARKKVDENYFYNKYLITGDIKYKRKADTRKAEFELMDKENEKPQKLNDLIKSVQIVLNLSFQIDPMKISAGYFLSLYNDVIKKAENGYN